MGSMYGTHPLLRVEVGAGRGPLVRTDRPTPALMVPGHATRQPSQRATCPADR